MKVWNRVLAAVMCTILLSSVASAADFSGNAADIGNSQPIQKQEIENDIEAIGEAADAGIDEAPMHLASDANEQSNFSTYEVRDPPLTEYDLVKCTGMVNSAIADQPVLATETFGTQGGSGYASFTLQNEYLREYPLRFTFYKYGNGYTGFDQGTNYRVNGGGSPYDLVFNSYGDAVGYKFDELIIVTDPSLSEITLVSTAQSRVTPMNTFVREVTVRFDDDRADPPTTPHFVPDPSNSTQYLLIGVDNSMEYRLSTVLSWTACEGNDIPIAALNRTVEYQVRYKSTESQAESKLMSLTLPARPAAPTASYDTSTEIISGLSASMEIKSNDGNYAPVNATTMSVSDLINNLVIGEALNISVRAKATATVQAGFDKTFTIYPRNAKPTTVKFNPVTTSLSGYTTAMQYQGDTDADWKAFSGTSLNLESYAKADRDVKVYVRLKPTATASASPSVEITIPQLLAGPFGRLDYDKEALVSLVNRNYQYSTNGTSWTGLTISDGQWGISQLITTSSTTLYLRKAATSTAPISAPTTFELPARATAPTAPVFVYNDSANPGKAVLDGLTSDMQFRKSTDTAWTDIPDGTGVVLDLPTASTTYYVRSKANDQAFASSNKTLTLLSPGTAPQALIAIQPRQSPESAPAWR